MTSEPRAMPGPFSGLSVKLIATITLVILAVEVVIYLPSAGNYRQAWLNDRLRIGIVAARVRQFMQEYRAQSRVGPLAGFSGNCDDQTPKAVNEGDDMCIHLPNFNASAEARLTFAGSENTQNARVGDRRRAAYEPPRTEPADHVHRRAAPAAR